MFPSVHMGGQTLCDAAAVARFGKPINQQNLRLHPQPAHAQDIRTSMANLTFSTMSAAGIHPFPGLSLTPIPAPTSGTFGIPPALVQYPSHPYPTSPAALGSQQAAELRNLSLLHQVSQANQNSRDREATEKMKGPIINRNYLELAMLVCNTFRGKLFPCPHCRYVTDRRNNLKRHISTMHQACEKQLECCGVTFSTKASLREHIMIFHHNGYSCPYCGRRFCRKALLKRHLSVHSGQKDYTCPHCDYATSHKSNLERHKRIHDRLKMADDGTARYHCDLDFDGRRTPPDNAERCIVVDDDDDDDGKSDIKDGTDTMSDLDEDVEVGCDPSYHSDDPDVNMPLDLQMNTLSRIPVDFTSSHSNND